MIFLFLIDFFDLFFFFSSRRRHTRCSRDWSSDVCSSDLKNSVDSELYTSDGYSIEGQSIDLTMPDSITLGTRRFTNVEVGSEERRVGKECRSRGSPYH